MVICYSYVKLPEGSHENNGNPPGICCSLLFDALWLLFWWWCSTLKTATNYQRVDVIFYSHYLLSVTFLTSPLPISITHSCETILTSRYPYRDIIGVLNELSPITIHHQNPYVSRVMTGLNLIILIYWIYYLNTSYIIIWIEVMVSYDGPS